MSEDTIAAVATPAGMGGVGVVRVSGPRARIIGKFVTGRRLEPRLATFCTFSGLGGTAIDHGLALFFPGPHSFTGEDVLELQGHGGPVVMDLVVARCLDLGARLARAGEFSERAFLNGKMDLAQAEATADLIESSTSLSAKLALRSLQGGFSRRVHSLIEELVRLRSSLEATLDFPDDELDPGMLSAFRNELGKLAESTMELLGQAHQGERVRDGLTVVIAGRVNAGKSSLLNALAQSDAAIVTAVPGTTRDVLRCHINIDGLPVTLVDTAGIRETRELVEQEGVRRAHKAIRQADHLLWVYDSRVGLHAEELTDLPQTIPRTLVRNKVDLELTEIAAQQLDVSPVLPVSALTGLGIGALRQHIRAAAGVEGLGEGAFVARRRHVDAIRRSLVALERARAVLDASFGTEVVAYDLVQAQAALGEITGAFTPDDLLDRIFSTFCIGK